MWFYKALILNLMCVFILSLRLLLVLFVCLFVLVFNSWGFRHTEGHNTSLFLRESHHRWHHHWTRKQRRQVSPSYQQRHAFKNYILVRLCNRVKLLCCCTLYHLYVTLSVSVSSFFFCWVWGRIMMSFICNNSFTYVLRIIILDVTKRQRERRREGITTASRMYHPKEKKK